MENKNNKLRHSVILTNHFEGSSMTIRNDEISQDQQNDIVKVIKGDLSSRKVKDMEDKLSDLEKKLQERQATQNSIDNLYEESDMEFMGGLPNDGGMIDAEMNTILEKLSDARLQITNEEMEQIKLIANKYR